MTDYPFAVYLHAHNVPGFGIDFTQDYIQNNQISNRTGWNKTNASIHFKVPATATAKDVAHNLAHLATKTGRKIKLVIINAHGDAGALELGLGIGLRNAGAFKGVGAHFTEKNHGFLLYCCNSAAAGVSRDSMMVRDTLGDAPGLLYSIVRDDGLKQAGVGHTLIRRWAKAAGVAVSAPYHAQLAALELAEGWALARPSGYFRGDWARAEPSGLITEYGGDTNPRDVDAEAAAARARRRKSRDVRSKL